MPCVCWYVHNLDTFVNELIYVHSRQASCIEFAAGFLVVSFLFCDPGFLISPIIVIPAAHIVVTTLNFCAWGR